MKKVFGFLRRYWLAILIVSIYAGAFTSYIIEPCAINMLLVFLLCGVAVFAILRSVCK